MHDICMMERGYMVHISHSAGSLRGSYRFCENPEAV